MNFIIFKLIFSVFITYNITQIISESTFPLFKWLRDLEYRNFIGLRWIGHLFGCFLCTGVWVGWFVAFFLFDVGQFLEIGTISWVWTGLFYSSLTWFIHCLEAKLG
jgi:hypothetical protein